MKSLKKDPSSQVARHHVGYYINDGYREVIQVEYRYGQYVGFMFRVKIQNKEYKSESAKYFDALSNILDQLPLTSAIVLFHKVIIVSEDSHMISDLEEWLYPYSVRDSGTVVYKLRLYIDQKRIETQKHLDFGNAAEDLRTQLGPSYKLQACYFCKYLIEYNEFGGTDYRHDQTYCFRDHLEDYEFLMLYYPNLYGKESLLGLKGIPNMDALHSCSSFTYRVEPRP